ncbi:DUF4148 domain-containing protein [Paraburkholderia fungorum]|uniref:DUF4148 domain-containing protein n=1 Tax=Paraburkholderia fungorum TaxID=134537 RepID=UPI0038BAB48C
MKVFLQAVAVAAVLSAPIVSFAQGTTELSRSQVRAELAQLERAGYHVGDGDNTQYPQQIQAAEARVAAQTAAAKSYGGVSAGSSDAGTRAHIDAGK